MKSSGNTTADSETTAKTITDGKTVEMAAGKNLTVKQTSNEDGAKVEYALSDDIKVGNDGKDGKDGVDGKIGVNGKDGSAVVINGKTAPSASMVKTVKTVLLSAVLTVKTA